MKSLWTGRILTILAVLFMLMDGVMKVVKPPFVVEASAPLGYPESMLPGIGVALIICTVLYAIPKTSVLGAILVTGYLGGAVASQVRVSMGLFSISFPILFACAVWGGLWLRDERLRNLVPLTNA